MALVFMDSFDHYGSADILEKWTSSEDVSRVSIGAYGRNSTQGLLVPNVNIKAHIAKTVLGGVDEVIVGVAVKPASWAGTLSSSIICLGSVSNWECGLMLMPDLTVRPFRVTSAGSFVPADSEAYWAVLVGSASSVALQVGVWSYVELRMKCSDASGTCSVRINGTEVLALTGLDTLCVSAVLTRFALSCQSNSGGSLHFDDLVVMDTSGSVNNSFLGDVTVSALYPNGAGATTGWTPSAGSNYDTVNEASPNDDTDYNATATLNAKDTYAMQDCAAGADIRAVQILASVRKASEGPGQVKLVTRSNSTDYDGAAQGIAGTTYAYVREIRETDPATAAAWTESGWNAVEIGLKKTG